MAGSSDLNYLDSETRERVESLSPELRARLLSDGVLCEMVDADTNLILVRLKPSLRRVVYGLPKPLFMSFDEFESDSWGPPGEARSG